MMRIIHASSCGSGGNGRGTCRGRGRRITGRAIALHADNPAALVVAVLFLFFLQKLTVQSQGQGQIHMVTAAVD